MQGVAFAQDVERFDGGTDDRWGDTVGEEVGTAALAEHVDDFLATGGKSSDSTSESLAKRTGVDVHAAIGVVEFAYAVTGGADNTCRVAFVDHDECVIFLGKVTDLVHGSHISVHGEHTVGDDDAETLCLCGLELTFQVLHVGVGVAVAYSLAESYAVND